MTLALDFLPESHKAAYEMRNEASHHVAHLAIARELFPDSPSDARIAATVMDDSLISLNPHTVALRATLERDQIEDWATARGYRTALRLRKWRGLE